MVMPRLLAAEPAPGLSPCGSRLGAQAKSWGTGLDALQRVGSPQPGVEPVSPALAA